MGIVFTVREESCWMPDPDRSDWSVSVVIDNEGAWLVGKERPAKRTVRPRRLRFAVPAEWAQARCAELRAITVPAVPEPVVGYDGGYTELCVEGLVSYRWWSVPPKGWEPLDALAREVLGWFRDELEGTEV